MARNRSLSTVLIGSLFLLAACSGGGSATTAPSVAASQPATSEAPASAAGSPAGSPAAGGGAPCAVATAPGTVAVKIAGFAFDPKAVTAKVGDTITWTNSDSTGHTATVKGQDACTTQTLGQGASGSITFTQAGTYDFFCKIHPSTMTGTITVS